MLALLISCFAVCSGLAIAACTDKNAANFRSRGCFDNARIELNCHFAFVGFGVILSIVKEITFGQGVRVYRKLIDIGIEFNVYSAGYAQLLLCGLRSLPP